MTRHKFRWTRERYKRACRLSRLLDALIELPAEAPELIKQLWSLWGRHPQRPDPLLLPLSMRYADQLDEVPF